MSIFGNIFKKKEDDFSFDSTDSFSPPPDNNNFSATSQTSDPFGTPGTDFGASSQTNDPFGTPQTNPAGQQQMSGTDPFGMPSGNQQTTPMPPIEDIKDSFPQSTGSQIAQKYINKQQSAQQPTTPQTSESNQTHNLELINLKLDAIKSQLETLNQRLQKIENEPKKLWR